MQKIVKIFFILSGFGFVGLGWIGAFLPGLPTVPFMILALACFAKSSERFHRWLYNHRLFGSSLQKWEKYRVIPVGAKVASLASMTASAIYMIFFTSAPLYANISAVTVMIIGAVYILSKPSFPPAD